MGCSYANRCRVHDDAGGGLPLLAVGITAFGGKSGNPYHAPKALTPAQFRRAGERIGRSICLQLKPIVP
jgi:hypothetical protein